MVETGSGPQELCRFSEQTPSCLPGATPGLDYSCPVGKLAGFSVRSSGGSLHSSSLGTAGWDLTVCSKRKQRGSWLLHCQHILLPHKVLFLLFFFFLFSFSSSSSSSLDGGWHKGRGVGTGHYLEEGASGLSGWRIREA